MDRFQYLLLMAACLAITLPLELVFRARVYRNPRRWAAAVLPTAAVLYLWDAAAIVRGHWWFAEQYTTGVVLPLGVPLEEAVFFLVIPTCGLLTLEAVRNLLDRRIRPWPLSPTRDGAASPRTTVLEEVG